jgi:hypothetical protein
VRHSEWHITVTGDPFQWQGFCASQGIKPLWIELNNFSTQLMCAANFNPTDAIQKAGWNIIRTKHEVSVDLIDVSTVTKRQFVHGALPEEPVLYYECHVKFDGRFQPQYKMTSRDLFRARNGADRWYATKREEHPFDADAFANFIHKLNGERSHLDSWEFEACLIDTNPGLDDRWR